MKKFFVSLMVFAAAATAFVSCNKNEIEQNVPAEGYSYSFIINDADTRATLDNGGVLWVSGDRTGMFIQDAEGAEVYTGYGQINANDTPKTVKLYSKTAIPAGSMAYAYYPYSADNDTDPDPSMTKIVISNIQQGGANSAMPMAGIPFPVKEEVPVPEGSTSTSTNGIINFLNLGAIIDFKVFSNTYSNEEVQYITFTADKTIAGDAYIDLTTVDPDDDNTLAIQFMGTENEYDEVRVNQNVNVAASKDAAESVYMAIAPGTYSGIITIGTDVATYTFHFENKTLDRNVLKHYNMNLNNATRVEEVIEIVKSLPYEEAFTTNQGEFTIEGSTGHEWSFGQYGATVTGYYQGEGESGKSNHAANTALVSPWIDLTNVTDAKITFSHNRNGFLNDSDVAMMIQKYGEDTWTDLELVLPDKPSVGKNFSGWKDATVSLTSFVGQKIKVKFTYVSTTSNAGTYEFKNFVAEKVKLAAGIAYAEADQSFELTVEDEFTAPTLINPNNLTVSYASDNEDVVLVDATTGEAVLMGAAGIATVTATFAGDDDYEAATASYRITVIDPTSVVVYTLYTGELVEGDYLITYDGNAMNTTVDKNRLQYVEVEAVDNQIKDPDASIVWHIAPSGNYWTIYNARANAYAAATGTKNQAQMLTDGTDDKSLWTVTGTETYDFVNKANDAANINKTLRNNGSYGFACYGTNTGGALTLYKLGTSGDTPAPTTYTITLNQPTVGGTIEASQTSAIEGSEISLTATTASGYEFSAWDVKDAEGAAVTVANNKFIMPASNVTVTATFTETQQGGDDVVYTLYTSNIVEGDYLIVADNGAMNTTVTSDRLQFTTVTPSSNQITNPDATIVWHIAASGDHWTIYNAEANAYAAGTGVKNKAQMLNDGTDDKSLWTITADTDGSFVIVNKANATANVNSTLRKNATYGFACYGATTGSAPTLYKAN